MDFTEYLFTDYLIRGQALCLFLLLCINRGISEEERGIEVTLKETDEWIVPEKSFESRIQWD